MPPLASWLHALPEGIYVEPADLWIDPTRPKPRAVITHGHADHARGGHGAVLATAETLAIMGVRYGEQAGAMALPYGEALRLGGVELSLAPAGHVLGSAQVILEHGGERVVVSGDYKRRPDPTCEPFLPVACDLFVTEATFALPVFRHPDASEELTKVLEALRDNPSRCVLVGAYALGKAQRLIAHLRGMDYAEPIYIHGALDRLCELYRSFGVNLGELRPATAASKADLAGKLVVAPPSALADRWSRRLPDPITAMASGWMRIRGRARQRGVELPLVVSDHADWDELTATCLELAPSEVWITHGREEALAHWCMTRQMKASALALVGREDEDD